MLEVHFDPFPVLTTERLILRRIGVGDIQEIFSMRSNVDIMKYICKPIPKSTEELLPLLKKIDDNVVNNEGIAWAMTMKGDSRMMGHISFHVIRKEHYRAEVGYMMFPEYYGKGIMDEALKVVLDYGFNTMGLHSVEAIASPDNAASLKLLEKNGFVKEAHFKEDFFWEGEFLDSVVYSLLRGNRR